MEWISVEDELPVWRQYVLCIDRCGEINVCEYDKPWEDDPPAWFSRTFGAFYPTHWMPLPERPQ
jgi:hypothetical protein